MDASQQLSTADGNSAFNIEQDHRAKKGYFKDFCRSFRLRYLKHKCFDEEYWKLAFCSSSFALINKYPNVLLIYRTILFAITIFDLLHEIVSIRSVHEWPINYTHLTLLITFFAVLFQFIIAYRVNFFRGNNIVPRHSLQCIHIVLILLSLGSGLAVCLLYWTVIHHSATRLSYPKIVLDHGILWFLLLIDIFLFTRLPFYMIDCIPLIIFASLYGVFTLIIFLFKSRFSRNRIGYVYEAFSFDHGPLRMTIHLVLFVFVVPCGIMFLLWNLFRLRRSIEVKTTEKKDESNSNILV